jgi:hypothetical protein
MGFWDSPQEEERKNRVKKMQTKIAEDGLSNIIDEKDYQKLMIEQNQTIIDLLTVSAIVQSGIAGDTVTIVHTNRYYDAIERIINNK